MTRIASHIILLVYDKAHLCRLISNLKLPSQTTVLIFLLLVKESLDDFQHKRQSILLILTQNIYYGRQLPYKSLLRFQKTTF